MSDNIKATTLDILEQEIAKSLMKDFPTYSLIFEGYGLNKDEILNKNAGKNFIFLKLSNLRINREGVDSDGSIYKDATAYYLLEFSGVAEAGNRTIQDSIKCTVQDYSRDLWRIAGLNSINFLSNTSYSSGPKKYVGASYLLDISVAILTESKPTDYAIESVEVDLYDKEAKPANLLNKIKAEGGNV